MIPEVPPAAGPDDAAIAENMLTVLREAGLSGATGAELALGKIDGKCKETLSETPRFAVLRSLVESGRVCKRRGAQGTRYILAELLPTPEGVAAKILARTFPDGDCPPVLWHKKELVKFLAADEKPLLPTALAWLEAKHELLRVSGRTGAERYLFAGPVRRWFGNAGSAPPVPSGERAAASAANGSDSMLLAAYTRAVRESGGFPDVKISALCRALPTADAAELPDRLRALWREGRLTLSLGDWSLANEEMRRAAVELEGERYLLVRFEEDAGGAPSLT